MVGWLVAMVLRQKPNSGCVWVYLSLSMQGNGSMYKATLKRRRMCVFYCWQLTVWYQGGTVWVGVNRYAKRMVFGNVRSTFKNTVGS